MPIANKMSVMCFYESVRNAARSLLVQIDNGNTAAFACNLIGIVCVCVETASVHLQHPHHGGCPTLLARAQSTCTLILTSIKTSPPARCNIGVGVMVFSGRCSRRLARPVHAYATNAAPHQRARIRPVICICMAAGDHRSPPKARGSCTAAAEFWAHGHLTNGGVFGTETNLQLHGPGPPKN